MKVPESAIRKVEAATRRRKWTAAILSVDVVVAAGLGWAWGGAADPVGQVALADALGLLAAGFLYLTLLVSPVMALWPKVPFRQEVFLARRGLGLSSLFFSGYHGWVSLGGPLGGWSGLAFLDPVFGLGVIFGVLAGSVLLLLGSTAWDGAVRLLGFGRWKRIHRWVYLAGAVVLAHGLLVGPHFADPQSLWTGYAGFFVLVLLALEALRFDRWYGRRFPDRQPGGPVCALAWTGLALASAWLLPISPWLLWAAGLCALVLAVPILLLDRWVIGRFTEVRRFGPGALVFLMVVSGTLSAAFQGGGFPLDGGRPHTSEHRDEPLP